jgi:hypothetical protein
MGLLLAAAIMGGGQMIGAQLSRDAAKRERDNHFVNLRESARRAGFNPLTALRATGGGGYGQYVPLLSRSPLGEGISAGTSFYANMQRDMYFTRENQAHEIAMNRMNNTAAMERLKANRSQVEPDVYEGYVEYIPVKVGNNIQQLDIGIAKRLNIPPNARLTQGELSELIGEISEVMNLPQNEIRDKILKPVADGGEQIDTDDWSVQDLVNETQKVLSRGWTEMGNAIDKGTTWLKQPNPNAMRTVITRGRQYGGQAGM